MNNIDQIIRASVEWRDHLETVVWWDGFCRGLLLASVALIALYLFASHRSRHEK